MTSRQVPAAIRHVAKIEKSFGRQGECGRWFTLVMALEKVSEEKLSETTTNNGISLSQSQAPASSASMYCIYTSSSTELWSYAASCVCFLRPVCLY